MFRSHRDISSQHCKEVHEVSEVTLCVLKLVCMESIEPDSFVIK